MLAIARLRQSLAEHVARLRRTLDLLRGQLREAIARSIGRSVAEAVTEAVQAVLSVRADTRVRVAVPLTERPGSLWDEPDRPAWDRYEEEPEERLWPEADDRDFRPEPPVIDTKQLGAPLNRAVAVGCQAASHWLRRHRGRFAVLKAIGVGLAAAATAFAGGYLIAGGIGVALCVLDLVSLSG